MTKFNIVFILFLLVACKKLDSSSDIESDSQKKIHFVEKSQLILELDKKSGFFNDSYAFNKSQNTAKDYYIFYNVADTTVVYYRLEDQKRFKFELQSDGEDGVGPLGFGVPMPYMVSENEFYLYNPSNGYLFLLNDKGKIQSKYLIYDFENSIDPTPRLSGWNPMILLDNALYLSCGLGQPKSNYRNYGSVLRYDLIKNERSYVFPFPELYSEAFWGAAFKYTPNLTLNGQKKQVLASFPVTPLIFSTNSEGKIVDSVSVSSIFIDKIQPYSKNVEDQIHVKNRDYNRERMHSSSNSDYGELIYDEYLDHYYRRVYLRPTADELQAGKRIGLFSIIVFDKDFNKLAEQKFSSKKYGQMIGVFSGGILMSRKDLYAENENQLVFDVFKLNEDLNE